MRVDAQRLRAFCEAALTAAGASDGDAATAAHILVRTDLRGVHSHGVQALPIHVRNLADGGTRSPATPETVRESAVTALIDGQAGMGLVIARHAVDVAIDKARTAGVGVVLVRNSNHFGAAGHYALTAAEAGYIGLATSNASPIMAAAGSKQKVISNAPYQAYRTSDGYVTVGANTEPMWEALCTQVLQAPHLLDDPRYQGKDARLAHADELERDLEAILETKPTSHWIDVLEHAGVPGGPVYTYDQTLADEHIVARGMIAEVAHPTMGVIKTLAPPIKFSETPLEPRAPAPWIGQHTIEVLQEIGVSAEDAEDLFRAGTLYDDARGAQQSHQGATP